jgi:hypothetical protein
VKVSQDSVSIEDSGGRKQMETLKALGPGEKEDLMTCCKYQYNTK